MYVWMDGWMDGWMYGCIDGWMDGCMDGWIFIYTHCVPAYMYTCVYVYSMRQKDIQRRGFIVEKQFDLPIATPQILYHPCSATVKSHEQQLLIHQKQFDYELTVISKRDQS